jgi:hypothetical protein
MSRRSGAAPRHVACTGRKAVHRDEPTSPIQRDALFEMLVIEREPTTRLMPGDQLRELLAETAVAPEIQPELETTAPEAVARGRAPDAATSWQVWLVGSAIALGSAVMVAMVVT